MVLMNLFAGQEQRPRRRGRACGHGPGWEGGTSWESSMAIYRSTVWNGQRVGTAAFHSSQRGAGHDPEVWGGGRVPGKLKRRGLCFHIADAHCSAAENTTACLLSYTSIGIVSKQRCLSRGSSLLRGLGPGEALSCPSRESMKNIQKGPTGELGQMPTPRKSPPESL